jgi:hypothetical protein
MPDQSAIRRRHDAGDQPAPRRRPTLQEFTDEQIRAADGVVLIDPNQPGWQQVLWSAEIKSFSPTSMLLQIIEIAVNARDAQQLQAARQRVLKLKDQKQSLTDTAQF